MNEKGKISISKERNVRTYAEMWHTSRVLLSLGKENPKGSYHHFIASLVFTAFTLEAYLNHIGPQIFKCWDSLERLSPKDKLNVVADRIDLEINYGNRPWQVMKDLFGFRNDIAHGKSAKVNETITLDTAKFDENDVHSWAKTKWEKHCNEKNAERARTDVRRIILQLHDSAGIDELPFQTGMQMSSAKIFEPKTDY